EGASLVEGSVMVWMINRNGSFPQLKEGGWQSRKLTPRGVDGTETRRYQLARTADGAVWLLRQGLWRFDGANWAPMMAGTDRLDNADLIGAAGSRLWISEL